MNFNLNVFLSAVANALDTIEINIFGMPTNHSKRIAYISVKIARELRLTNEEIFDLASLAIMHDNGASMKILHDKLLGTTKEKINVMESRKGHCIIGCLLYTSDAADDLLCVDLGGRRIIKKKKKKNKNKN